MTNYGILVSAFIVILTVMFLVFLNAIDILTREFNNKIIELEGKISVLQLKIEKKNV